MARQAFILANEAVRNRAIDALRTAPVGWRVEISEPRRTLDQNAKLWAMLGDVSKQVEWYGEHLSPDDWKTVLTASLRKARVIPGLDAGTLVPLGLSTSGMTKRELADLVELIYAFGSERGVIWSEPQREEAA